MTDSDPTGLEQATLGGGCFWCTDAVFKSLRGVVAVEPGYAGGHADRPSYQQVCSGTTGHAEVTRISFDPAQLSFEQLLGVYFATHDPTQLNRQGNDIGEQYRSVVFAHSAEQERVARGYVQRLTEEAVFDDPIVTAIEPLTTYWTAEQDHHDFFARNPDQAYCAAVVAPKVAKFRRQFADLLQG